MQAQTSSPHESVCSPADRRRLQQLLEQGLQLAKDPTYDHDLVNKLLTECVVTDPSNIVYVDVFLDNLQRKFKNNLVGARVRVFTGKGTFKKAVAKRDWAEVFRLGPAVLKTNPWDVSTLQGMALACEAAGDPAFDEVELRYLRNAGEAKPESTEVNRQLARSLSRMGRFDQAMVRWEAVLKSSPGDSEAVEALSYLRGTGEGAEPTTPDLRSRKETAAASPAKDADTRMLEQQLNRIIRRRQSDPVEVDARSASKKREIKLTRRQVLEQNIHVDPTEIGNYLELAEILAFEERYGEAKRVLSKAHNVSPGDIAVMERLEDMEIRQARNQLAVAEMQAAKLETDAAHELVERLRHELHQLEIEQYASRCRRYPQDHGLMYEFGLRLKRAGRYSDALIQFQGAFQAEGQRVAVLIALGECCQHLRQYEKALNHYLAAAEGAEPPDQLDLLLLANYRAGVLATGMRRDQVARSALETVMRHDPDYKDARLRLDKLPPIGDSD